MNRKIAVIGLGYVGLPVALAFAKKFPGTIGFDINAARVDALSRGVDVTGDVAQGELSGSSLRFTSIIDDLRGADFFVVAVPTPVDEHNRPDLGALVSASKTVGSVVRKGAVVVFESTVYPGVTEEVCGPAIAAASGLRQGVDFKLGYSPERINPGDREHTIEKIVKVVSGEDAECLDVIANCYGEIIEAGIHRASGIKVAEAAKVIENTQRDLNIALMNELSIIFDKLGISTKEVLDAAATKWNFLRFHPGLVGGHCIGVDPYYLTTKAEQLGYHPEVILAGRRINDGMGSYVAQRLVKLLINAGGAIKGARVAVLGLSFKENVSDIRNSRVPTIVSELEQYGVVPLVHDPLADRDAAKEEYGIDLHEFSELNKLDAVVFAVAHREYVEMGLPQLTKSVRQGGVFVDVKSAFRATELRDDLIYWSL